MKIYIDLTLKSNETYTLDFIVPLEDVQEVKVKSKMLIEQIVKNLLKTNVVVTEARARSFENRSIYYINYKPTENN